MLVDNLVPCCNTCNHNKSDDWLSGKQRLVLHLYFDLLPSEQYLFAKIHWEHGHPVALYELRKVPGLSKGMYGLLETHYKKLKLLERYSQASSTVLSEIVEEVRGTSQRMAIQQLKATGYSLTRVHGSNYWKAALYEAAAAPDFLKKMGLWEIASCITT